jgi:tRNA pseudouridine55 synthase
MSSINGVLPIDKPVGPTSHDIVASARRALGVRRIGHTGTLDPFASGLLLLCVGPSTRLAEYLASQEKSYSATMVLGVATDTDDHLGAAVSESEEWRELPSEVILSAFAEQTGVLQQVPPQYSAKKIDGERMYDIARRGGVVDLPKVEVTVHRLTVTRVELPEIDFDLDCSTGTYIRSIARDVGASLGVGGHLTALRRTRIGSVGVDDALSLDQLADPDAIRDALLPPAAALTGMPRAILADSEVVAVRLGKSVENEAIVDSGPVAMVTADGELIAIGERVGARLQPRKVFEA